MQNFRPLSAAFVKTVSEPGDYGDGRSGYGLYLLVRKYGEIKQPSRISKSWAQRLTINKKRCKRGLGSFPLISLAEARQRAFENAKAAWEGQDPRKIAAAKVNAEAEPPTFTDCLESALVVLRRNWRHPRTEKQLRFFLAKYALPHIGKKPIDAITPGDVLKFLAPLMVESPASGRKTQDGLRQVFNWAVSQGLRQNNPADKTISHALPKRSVKEHYPALPFAQVGTAMQTVEQTTAWLGTKLCFALMVLTATRSGESRLATWEEIDLDTATWTIPAHRMKAGREHRVPLSKAAVSILQQAKALTDGRGLVFPSARGKAMSDSTVSKLLRQNGIAAVPHGFRSSFRDWCAENNVNRQLAETALAHAVGSATEAAYLRSDMFDLRRALMQEWADYLGLDGKGE